MLYFQLKSCVLLNCTNMVTYLNLGEWSTLSDSGGDGDDGGRIFQQHQPPPHHAQGYHIPFGSPLTPISANFDF